MHLLSLFSQVEMNKKNKKSQNKTKVSLREIYEKKREEEEKARMEKEAAIQAKKEEIDKANAQRKATREKMFKKTRSGQPVMKYRIEHLLETIQGSKIYS
uniref:rRNA-processing protein FYV7 n=1 Tax=Cannabis sativa TaxID=3483 RepID=A0A803NQF8_CANSA